MQILVNYTSFLKYQEIYGTTYLDKENGYQIWSPSKSFILNGFNPVNEIFDGIGTEYNISKIDNDYLISFSSNLGNEYRLDLLKDPLSNIYHIAFSLFDINDDDDYEKPTNLQESKEVFGKLAYILRDISKKINVSEYCIESTGNIKKDKIYEYIMKYTSTWEKRNTDDYSLGWALYFII